MMSDKNSTPPVCSYESSDYQDTFWEKGGRAYEDSVEAIAIKRLLPESGKLMLELGAGAGRNTLRYAAYERVVLVDFSRTQLEQALARLGDNPRYVFVAADVYRLPFTLGLFDGATMIRTLHHMADPTLALRSIKMVLAQEAVFILEFANKRNLKSVIRYFLKKQTWNPFAPEAVEFAELNFDFHPKTVREWLLETDFAIDKQLTVSHFRMNFLKRYIPLKVLTAMDASLQWTGAFVQYSPSVFTRAIMNGDAPKAKEGAFFQCPECWQDLPEEKKDLKCPKCARVWVYRDGIYDFRV
ncbi:MAG: methyltransferase domain-containing protein [Anaerolineaceae bacterium]|nr:methyltransferase domain-containing protein [Anaerolineaceae bacterium]